MPLSENNRLDINTLRTSYNALPWYAKWFFPSSMSEMLFELPPGSADEATHALTICNVFLNKTWFIQRLFFSLFDSCLETFSYTQLVLAADQLNTAGLLTGDMAQGVRDAVAGSQNPRWTAEALRTLHTAGLLTGDRAQANRAAVAGSQNLWPITYALRTLHTAGLLTGDTAQDVFDTVAGNPRSIYYALSTLHTAGLLTGVAGQGVFDTVARSQYPWSTANALCTLHTAGLLTEVAAQGVVAAVAGSQNPESIADALRTLYSADLLTGDKAEANRDAVFMMHLAIFVGADREAYLDWSRIPVRRLTQTRFDAMITICQQHRENPTTGRACLTAYVNREILGIISEEMPGAAQAPVFNERQSTHMTPDDVRALDHIPAAASPVTAHPDRFFTLGGHGAKDASKVITETKQAYQALV